MCDEPEDILDWYKDECINGRNPTVYQGGEKIEIVKEGNDEYFFLSDLQAEAVTSYVLYSMKLLTEGDVKYWKFHAEQAWNKIERFNCTDKALSALEDELSHTDLPLEGKPVVVPDIITALEWSDRWEYSSQPCLETVAKALKTLPVVLVAMLTRDVMRVIFARPLTAAEAYNLAARLRPSELIPDNSNMKTVTMWWN
jgi:hypothetical protein